MINQKVDEYIANLDNWNEEMTLLRQIASNCGLLEEFKWKRPCYTDKNKLILIIHEFKDYCAILFNKGILLNDSKNILVQQTENTLSARQLRFKNVAEIYNLESVIKEYIFEAVEVERAGLQVKKKLTSDFEVPVELTQKFKENTDLEAAFNNLTEGRKRAYLIHFAKPKQSKTKISRIDSNAARIMSGKGLNDCTCGLTKRKPNCDGSHKQLNK